jgi:hypothetical protein
MGACGASPKRLFWTRSPALRPFMIAAQFGTRSMLRSMVPPQLFLAAAIPSQDLANQVHYPRSPGAVSGRVDAQFLRGTARIHGQRPECARSSPRSIPVVCLPIDVKMVNGVAATAIGSEGQYATIKDRAVFSSTALFLWGPRAMRRCIGLVMATLFKVTKRGVSSDCMDARRNPSAAVSVKTAPRRN